MAIHVNDLVVVSDVMVSSAHQVDIDTVFIVFKGPYESEYEIASSKRVKALKICVDIMGNGRIFEKIPCGWLIRAKSKHQQQK